MISFRDWLSESLNTLRSGDRSLPARAIRPLYYLYVAAFLSATQYVSYGTNIYDREWDALIVLDACRVDALREVGGEYDFITEVGSMRSVGSTSFEWLNHTFAADYREEVRRTAHLTRNGYTARVFGEGGETGSTAIPFGPSAYDVVDPEGFAYLEELWRLDDKRHPEWTIGEGETEQLGPGYTTDRAIAVGRAVDYDRLVVHYIYPHDPFPLAESVLRWPFEALQSGDASRAEVWEAYLDNLDAERVAITADHGEAFGEYGFYRHVIGCPIPCMRRVPWVETTAADSGMYESTAPEPAVDDETVSVEDRLKKLGYL